MLVKFNFGWFFVAICCLFVGLFTLTGDVQKIIEFANPIGELAFCILFFIIGLFSFAGAIQVINERKIN